MASEMIERAAKAAAEVYGHDWAELPVENPIANGEHDRVMFVEMVTAAIHAIREPSEAMIKAGQATECEHGELNCGCAASWRAMIDTALNEPR